jgi:hypothetical protein
VRAARRDLYITGKDTVRDTHLTDERIAQTAVQLGDWTATSRKRVSKLTEDQIFDLLTRLRCRRSRSIGARDAGRAGI